MCRHPVADDVEQCYDEFVNPNHGGRPTPNREPGSLYDSSSCHEHTEMLYWSDLRIVDKIFSVKKDTICMVIFNNLSGVTYRVSLKKLGTIDGLKRLFYMTTADEFDTKKKLSVMEASPTDYEVGALKNKKDKSYALDKPCNFT